MSVFSKASIFPVWREYLVWWRAFGSWFRNSLWSLEAEIVLLRWSVSRATYVRNVLQKRNKFLGWKRTRRKWQTGHFQVPVHSTWRHLRSHIWIRANPGSQKNDLFRCSRWPSGSSTTKDILVTNCSLNEAVRMTTGDGINSEQPLKDAYGTNDTQNLFHCFLTQRKLWLTGYYREKCIKP